MNAPESGTIKEFLVSEDDTVTVGQEIVKLEPGSASDAQKSEKPGKQDKKEPSPSDQPPSEPEKSESQAEPKSEKSETPAAKAQSPKPEKPKPQPEKKTQPSESEAPKASGDLRSERRVRYLLINLPL